MKKLLSSTLLLLGTILGALAAAEGQKPWIYASFEELSGAEPPPALFEALGVFEADTILDEPVIANLRDAGFTEAKVPRYPVTAETLDVGDGSALLGRVLDEEVPSAEGTEGEGLAAGTFLDEAALEPLLATGVQRVSVRVPKQWSFGRWGASAWFIGALLMMLAAVFLNRTSDDAPTAGGAGAKGEAYDDLKGLLGDVRDGASAAIERVESLSPEAASEELEGLGEGVLTLVEQRQVLAKSLGVGPYAEFMGQFSAAERDLNRAWSAAVDGYPQESRESLTRAAAGFAAAHERL